MSTSAEDFSPTGFAAGCEAWLCLAGGLASCIGAMPPVRAPFRVGLLWATFPRLPKRNPGLKLANARGQANRRSESGSAK
jgi:hypothetical protein